MDVFQSTKPCANCGGELAFNPDKQRLECTYCNSRFTLQGELLTPKFVFTRNPDAIIPFKAGQKTFDDWARNFLSPANNAPADITGQYNSSITKGCYLPVYLLEIRYTYTLAQNDINDTYRVYVSAANKVAWPDEITEVILGNQQLATTRYIDIKIQWQKPDPVFTTGYEIADDEFAITPDVDNTLIETAKKLLNKNLGFSEGTGHNSAYIFETIATLVYLPIWINRYHYNSNEYYVVQHGANAGRFGYRLPEKETTSKTGFWSRLF